MYSPSDNPKGVGFPHSDISGSKVICHLPRAFRRLSRLSSPVIAKAFTICTYSLDLITLLTNQLVIIQLNGDTHLFMSDVCRFVCRNFKFHNVVKRCFSRILKYYLFLENYFFCLMQSNPYLKHLRVWFTC